MMKITFLLVFTFLSLASAKNTNRNHRYQQLTNQSSEHLDKENSKIEKWIHDIENKMKPTADPCDNFFEFVCGNSREGSTDRFSARYDEVINRVIQKYEEDGPNERLDKVSLIRNAKNIYKSCKNYRTYELLYKYVLNDLESMGGWPLLKNSSWNETAFDWKRPILRFRNQPMWRDYLLNFRFFRIDDIFYLVRAHPAHRDYNHTFMVSTASELAAGRTLPTEELNKVQEFATNLSEINSRWKGEHIIVTLQDLINDFPFYPWLENFRQLIPEIRLNQNISVSNYNLLNDLHDLINKTDKRTRANFVAWTRLHSLVDFLEPLIDFGKSTNNNSLACYNLVSDFFPEASSAVYVREYIDHSQLSETTRNAETISDNIRKHFVEMVNNAEWLNDKSHLVDKIGKIYYQFGYPLELLNDTLLNEYDGTLTTNGTNFFESAISFLMFYKQRRSRNVPASALVNEETLQFASTNYPKAMYRELINSIEMTASLLEAPYFDKDHPMWLTYATFGSVMGHEFGHSLDPLSIEINTKGENVSWLSNSANYVQYHQKINCLEDRYKQLAGLGNVSIDLNGHELFVMRDNVADNLGFRAAYLAYKGLPVKEKSRRLHNKEYSPEQLFWISAGSQWCSKIKPVNGRIETNVMSCDDIQNPPERRILGSLSNYKEFSEDFNCPRNSKMNPESKCILF